MNELKIINEQEILGKNFRVYGTPDLPLFLARDVAEWIDYDVKNAYRLYDAVDEDEKMTCSTFFGGQLREMKFLTEDGLYEVLMQSHKPLARQFKKKVKEILKMIRKTGGYVNNEELFINTYLPYADEGTKLIFAQTLRTVREQNETIERQRKEISHKEDVIIGLVEDIDLATKRQRITQIVRHGADGNYQERYNLLYMEFERKYHCDLKRRMKTCNLKPKAKNKMDYIDREMNMIPQLYEIACKLFENDV